MNLRESEESAGRFHESTLEQAAHAIFWIDPGGKISRVNQAACIFLGYSKDEITSKTVNDIVVDYKNDDWIELLSSLRKSRTRLFELEMMKNDGTVIPVEINASHLEIEDVEYISFFVHDIVERRRVEGLLRNSQSNLEEAQRLAHLGSWEWSIETNELFWSDEIYRIFGLTPQEFGATYDAFLESVHPDDREDVMRSVDEALNGKKPYDIEHRVIQRTGDIRVVNERAEVTFDAAGRAMRMIGTVQDITERKQAEEALRSALQEVEKLKSRLQAEKDDKIRKDDAPEEKEELINGKYDDNS